LSTGNVSLTGNVTGAPTGSRTFGPLTITANSAVDATQVVSLINGALTVTVPTGATAAILAPPNATSPSPNPAFAGTLTLKGISGDSGVAISNKYPTLISWDTAPASFVVASTVAGTLEIFFI
jgi:hypothetical protein